MRLSLSMVDRRLAVLAFGLLAVGCRGRRNAQLHALEDAQAAAPSASTSAPTAQPVIPEPARPTPEENAIADAADARKNLWLSTPLTGHDNRMAAIRAASITRDETLGHKLVIKNQFGLTCGLRFGRDGSPAEITTKCRGTDGWGSGDDRIALTCEEKETQEICRGKYSLIAPGNFKSAEVLQIIRPLRRP